MVRRALWREPGAAPSTATLHRSPVHFTDAIFPAPAAAALARTVSTGITHSWRLTPPWAYSIPR